MSSCLEWHAELGNREADSGCLWCACSGPTDAEVVQIASGGLTPKCSTTGDDLLNFWGYHLSVAECVGILLAFYVVFHLGSYLALSKLYKQKR